MGLPFSRDIYISFFSRGKVSLCCLFLLSVIYLRYNRHIQDIFTLYI